MYYVHSHYASLEKTHYPNQGNVNVKSLCWCDAQSRRRALSFLCALQQASAEDFYYCSDQAHYYALLLRASLLRAFYSLEFGC